MPSFVVSLKVYKFIFDRTSKPVMGTAESLLATKQFTCVWTLVARVGLPPIGNTPPAPATTIAKQMLVHWRGYEAEVVIEEEAMEQFHERVLLFQIVEVPNDVVLASGTIDPGVFLHKPAKDYAVKMENNFTTAGKLFLQLGVQSLEAASFHGRTTVDQRMVIRIEKIYSYVPHLAVGQQTPAKDEMERSNLSAKFSRGVEYMFKVKHADITHRTPSVRCDNERIIRWNYSFPCDASGAHPSTRLKLALFAGSSQVSSFAIDSNRLKETKKKLTKGGTEGEYTVLVPMPENKRAVLDFSVQFTEVLRLVLRSSQQQQQQLFMPLVPSIMNPPSAGAATSAGGGSGPPTLGNNLRVETTCFDLPTPLHQHNSTAIFSAETNNPPTPEHKPNVSPKTAEIPQLIVDATTRENVRQLPAPSPQRHPPSVATSAQAENEMVAPSPRHVEKTPAPSPRNIVRRTAQDGSSLPPSSLPQGDRCGAPATPEKNEAKAVHQSDFETMKQAQSHSNAPSAATKELVEVRRHCSELEHQVMKGREELAQRDSEIARLQAQVVKLLSKLDELERNSFQPIRVSSPSLASADSVAPIRPQPLWRNTLAYSSLPFTPPQSQPQQQEQYYRTSSISSCRSGLLFIGSRDEGDSD